MSTLTTHHSPVTLNGEEGLVLRGEFPGTFCFVPNDCAEIRPDTHVVVLRSRYLMSTWARRNVRLNPGRTVGSHLFPEEGAEPLSADEASVRRFLQSAAKIIG
ncbi:hypothetical protein [Geminisphaera colitermitum]|uniref:hypothetical protein n=1 Tax=Geminisphaera colitermitum TaxID=1148786 RepID=UPI0012FEA388|nr:hypothetical protein [Geminisphaera colitermitum]